MLQPQRNPLGQCFDVAFSVTVEPGTRGATTVISDRAASIDMAIA